MKLFYSPGACSLGIHILLIELGKPFELVRFLTKEGQTRTSEYLALYPKGKVPVLVRGDGFVLTEFPTIAFHLAWSNPEADLLPRDVDGQTRALELFEYLVSSVHMRGLHRMYNPARIAPGADEAAVLRDGLGIVRSGLDIVDAQLAGRDYALGDFSIVDSAVFYVLLNAYRLQIPFGSNTERYFDRMLSRPSVRQVLAAEGIADWVSHHPQYQIPEIVGGRLHAAHGATD